MEYFDSCGLDLHQKVQSYLYPTLCNAPQPQKILTENVRAGNLGQKSRRGLYDWSNRDDGEFRRRRNKRFVELLKADRGGGL
jgi:3-hydroxyacyl-CoA dehydrogenase